MCDSPQTACLYSCLYYIDRSTLSIERNRCEVLTQLFVSCTCQPFRLLRRSGL